MKKLILLLITVFCFASCEDILDQTPKAAISSENFDDPVVVEGLVVAAYASLKNIIDDDFIATIFNPPSNWSYCDVRSDDAYKGGGGTGDLSELNAMELGVVLPTNSLIARKWRALYIGVSRCNKALQALNAISEEALPEKQIRIGEVRVLRGHYYFELKRHFFVYPYVDETVEAGNEASVPNDLSSQELWDLIENDFLAGIAALPETQNDLGRVNRFAAHAYLCKTYIYQGLWTEALAQADLVINSGQYRLLDDLNALYSDPRAEFDGEHIFAMQNNVGGGGPDGGNYNWGDLLTSPRGPAYVGGDVFHVPSQNLINAFKVDPNSGLPLFDTFDQNNLASNDTATAVDPRLDHSVGRIGIPWRGYTEGTFSPEWLRDPGTYGNFAKKKNLIAPTLTDFRPPGPFPWARGALNYPFIRYAEVLLWKAEALIESGGSLEEARQLINQIRERAMNSPTIQTLDPNNPAPAANYQIGLYPATGWTQDVAREALRFERRLELCLEGHRFYDLVRWGVAEQVMDAYYASESQDRPYLGGGDFIANRHEYLPIPQQQLDLSDGTLTQNQFYQ